jgi:hypothetical protein
MMLCFLFECELTALGVGPPLNLSNAFERPPNNRRRSHEIAGHVGAYKTFHLSHTPVAHLVWNYSAFGGHLVQVSMEVEYPQLQNDLEIER